MIEQWSTLKVVKVYGVGINLRLPKPYGHVNFLMMVEEADRVSSIY